MEIKYLEDSLLIGGILIFGDVHLGKADSIVFQLEELIEKFDRIFGVLDNDEIKVKKIVILGDLKHEFGGISDVEWRESFKFFEYLENKVGKKIILIKGNHDNILKPIAEKLNYKVRDYYRVKKLLFIHGDRVEEKWLDNVDGIIMGHLHPSVTLYDEYKSERFKCFLKGIWKRKNVLILPHFSSVGKGFDLNDLRNSDDFSFIGNKELERFKVIIYNNKENKIHSFGKVKSFCD